MDAGHLIDPTKTEEQAVSFYKDFNDKIAMRSGIPNAARPTRPLR